LSSTLNISQCNTLGDYVTNQIVTNRDSNFGISFKNMKNLYFKEYNVELFGKDTPGPGVYSPNVTFFKKDKHEAKSFTMVSNETIISAIHYIGKKRMSFGPARAAA